MAATTPKYAFPYPQGTDRVMDGDNAIQALAEKVEAVMGTGRTWTGLKGADLSWSNPSVATPLYTVTLTGAKAGDILQVTSTASIKSDVVSDIYATVQANRATVTPSGAALGRGGAGEYVSLTYTAVLTVTDTNPDLTVTATVAAGSGTISGLSHLTVVKVA